MSNQRVTVTRVVTYSYTLDRDAWEGMSKNEIEEFECQGKMTHVSDVVDEMEAVTKEMKFFRVASSVMHERD